MYVIRLSQEKLDQVRNAKAFIDGYYGKTMVIANEDGSFFNREEGADVSAENIIAWEKRIRA